MNPGILIDRYVPDAAVRTVARQFEITYTGKTKAELIDQMIYHGVAEICRTTNVFSRDVAMVLNVSSSQFGVSCNYLA